QQFITLYSYILIFQVRYWLSLVHPLVTEPSSFSHPSQLHTVPLTFHQVVTLPSSFSHPSQLYTVPLTIHHLLPAKFNQKENPNGYQAQIYQGSHTRAFFTYSQSGIQKLSKLKKNQKEREVASVVPLAPSP
ncbi:hypothetical protein VIGAN_04292900, partial [Vigna angularis var. angularis]